MTLSLCLTKVLLLNSNSLIIGPNLPINLSSHKMVTTPDEKKVIVAGGETGTGQMSNLLIKYSGLGSSWTIMNEKKTFYQMPEKILLPLLFLMI